MWWFTAQPSIVLQIAKQIATAIDEDMPVSVVLTPAIGGVEVNFWGGSRRQNIKAGCYLQLPKPVGIKIVADVVVLASGTLKFVQNVQRVGTRYNADAPGKECLSVANQGKWMLDGGDPYQGKSKTITKAGRYSFEASDSPGQCLSDPKLETIEISETFRTYLMWKAKPRKKKTKGAAGWNVIGCVEWSWSGSASPTPDPVKPGVVCGISSGGIKYRWKRLAGASQAASIQTPDTPVASPGAIADDWSAC